MVNLAVQAGPGYSFVGWSGPDGGKVVDNRIVMDANRSITAVFVQVHSLTLDVSPAGSGTVEVAVVDAQSLADTIEVNHNQTVRLAARPARGYLFDHWEQGLSGSRNPEQLTVTEPATVTAVFVPGLSGRVTGASTQSGIQGVTMSIESDQTAVTDPSGYWSAKGSFGVATVTPRGLPGFPGAHFTPRSTTVTWPADEITILLDSWYRLAGAIPVGYALIDHPKGIAIDSEGNIYVAMQSSDLVVKLTSMGTLLAKWSGSSAEAFYNPYSVAVDGLGNVYVADTGNNQGVYLAEWGGNGYDEGEFQGIHGLAVASTGAVCGSDWTGHRVQIFELVKP